ncbi:SufD family Fe-S cluster assembly protein [Candidatus Peregrinibacteria bacterium]|nr:SufD family Fe-S cluster assembly protein [Candidatus Peregrinibacteria bacterium]
MVPLGAAPKELTVKRGRSDCFFEKWNGQGDRIIDIAVQPGASCVFVTFNQSGTSKIVQRGRVEKGGHLHWINVTCGKNVDHVLESRVCGEGGVSTIDWIFLGMETDTQHIRARNIFDACSGRGDITIHGAALDAAHIRCEGKIEISPFGDGTQTTLREGVLILDPEASVRVIPCLDVRTNNVKASHAATVSRLTDDDVFYFGSRGIARDAARQMLVEGFLGEIIQRVPDGNIRKKIQKELFPKTGSRGPQFWGTPLKGKGHMGETVGFRP